MSTTVERTLLTAVSDLSSARELASVTAVVRVAAGALTGADGVSFVLKDQNQGTAVRVEFPIAVTPLAQAV